MSCEADLVIPYKSVFSVPIILKQNNVAITYNDDLLFMVKESFDDPDASAIISKTLTIVNPDGDPYHAEIDFDLTDTSHPIGRYVFGFKTHLNGDWLPTNSGIAEITHVIVQGQTA